MKVEDDLVLTQFDYSVIVIAWIRRAFFCRAFRSGILTVNCQAAQVNEFLKLATLGHRREIRDAAQHRSIVSQGAINSDVTLRERLSHLFTIEDVHSPNFDGQAANT